ncbi:hypothetical protein CDLVIII_2421 [Clostridium sp. DL-VIII]|uniref:hypothetical protein n=1 Tax=Clostridium sp. DL-VIII TaxID=641107 RepID=UPI00023AFEF7|nr:hypothetical protein [Clostridium sp. DL-VIII]EHI99066.1 hypothetical protein CDLVIII_2421 [Clostridium sp. DL-VIII]
MIRDEKYYEKLFEDYPDVVNIKTFREMLGGISEQAARRLMRENRVRHYFVSLTYMIPKVWIIEYVLSEDYEKYKEKLKVQI